jgi:hypothetical protein
VSGGWGTADAGGAWTISGTPSQFSVGGGAGAITLSTSTSQQAMLNGASSANTRLVASFSVDKIANAQYISLIGRGVGSSQYLLRVRVAGDGTAQLLVMNGGAAIGGSVTVPSLVMTPGTAYKVAFEVKGTSPTTLSGKMWKASDAEPGAWQVTQSDSTAALQAAGSVGVYSYVPAAANAYPLKLAFSDITATVP